MSFLFLNVYASFFENYPKLQSIVSVWLPKSETTSSTEVEVRNLHTDKWDKFDIIIIKVEQEQHQ